MFEVMEKGILLCCGKDSYMMSFQEYEALQEEIQHLNRMKLVKDVISDLVSEGEISEEVANCPDFAEDLLHEYESMQEDIEYTHDVEGFDENSVRDALDRLELSDYEEKENER